MKKLITIIALAASTSLAMADSMTVEYTDADIIESADQMRIKLGYKHEFNKAWAGDIAVVTSITDGTNTLGVRQEAGITHTFGINSNIKGYMRGGIGQKLSNTKTAGYYLVEPGITIPAGNISYKLGYRYRSATDAVVNNDQTHTVRAAISYALNKQDTFGLGVDRMRGDSVQNSIAVSYTRNF